jgi:site-specific DNA-methyltransferase (adenine-specific)
MNIDLIKPYARNAKKHPKKQIDQIANSIKEFGFNQPVVIDKNNIIIVGHGRYLAAQKLKMKDIPVIVANLNEEQSKSYRLADNKLNESDWEMSLVIEELKELSIPMVDLTGFDRDLIFDTKEDNSESKLGISITKTKHGDIYELGRHRLICEDSTKKEAY